jgi:hypothetical protein
MFSGAAACGEPWMDSNTDFIARERFVSLNCYVRARREPRERSPMDFVNPLVSRLSAVTAYVAFAFVAAIVLGVI